MKPVIIMAVAAAAIAMSIGYMGNDMNLSMVQSLGAGETDFQSPIDTIDVSLRVDRTFGVISADFKDFIVDCVFSSPSEVENGSTLICKLVIEGDHIVAEGRKVLSTVLPQNSPTVIPIDMTAYENANKLNDIIDMIIIVQGPSKIMP